jgi:hypothetical protein
LVILFKINKIDISALAGSIKGAQKLFLVIAFCIYFLAYILGFLRWRMLLKAIDVNIPLKRLISSFSGGVFFNIFLPSTIGGDLIRAADLTEHTKKAKEVIATVLLDRISGYIGLVFVIITALILGGRLVLDKVILTSVSAIILFLVVGLLVLFNNSIYAKISKFLSSPGAGKIKETIKNMHQEIHAFRNHKNLIVGNLALSFLIQLVTPVAIYFIGLSLGIKISPQYFFIFIPIIGAITLLPIAIGGLGLREYLFVIYFAKAGVIEQLALAMSLLSFFFVVFCAAIGGLVYVLTVRYRCLQPDKPSCV